MGGGVSKETKSLMLDAVSHGESFRVKRLIAAINSPGTTAKMVNTLANRDRSPLLHLAVLSADGETVKVLLASKADPNRKSVRDGSTALLRLADIRDELNALEIAKSLLDGKASINQTDAFDQTVLYLCAATGGSLLIKYLLDRGASPIHVCRTFGKTLLFHCVEQARSLAFVKLCFFNALGPQGMLAASLSRLIDAGAEFTDAERGKVPLGNTIPVVFVIIILRPALEFRHSIGDLLCLPSSYTVRPPAARTPRRRH